MDKIVNAVYKLGAIWDKYSFYDSKRKTISPHTLPDLVLQTFLPGPYVVYVYDFVKHKTEYISDSYTEVFKHSKNLIL